MLNMKNATNIRLESKTGRPTLVLETAEEAIWLYAENPAETRHWLSCLKTAANSADSRENVFTSRNSSRALLSITASVGNTSTGASQGRPP